MSLTLGIKYFFRRRKLALMKSWIEIFKILMRKKQNETVDFDIMN